MEIIYAIVVSLIVEALKKVGWEKKPWWTTHLLVMIIAGILAVARLGLDVIPEAYFIAIRETWISAVVIYEVLIKRVINALQTPSK